MKLNKKQLKNIKELIQNCQDLIEEKYEKGLGPNFTIDLIETNLVNLSKADLPSELMPTNKGDCIC